MSLGQMICAPYPLQVCRSVQVDSDPDQFFGYVVEAMIPPWWIRHEVCLLSGWFILNVLLWYCIRWHCIHYGCSALYSYANLIFFQISTMNRIQIYTVVCLWQTALLWYHSQFLWSAGKWSPTLIRAGKEMSLLSKRQTHDSNSNTKYQ